MEQEHLTLRGVLGALCQLHPDSVAAPLRPHTPPLGKTLSQSAELSPHPPHPLPSQAGKAEWAGQGWAGLGRAVETSWAVFVFGVFLLGWFSKKKKGLGDGGQSQLPPLMVLWHYNRRGVIYNTSQS